MARSNLADGFVMFTLSGLAVLACGGASPGVSTSPTETQPIVSCEAIYSEARAIIPRIEHRQGKVGTNKFGETIAGSPPENIFSSNEVRLRAARVCACRAGEHRASANLRQTEATTVTVVGGLAVAGGGAVTGIAGTIGNEERRQSWSEAGLVTLAVGTFAFGIYTALNMGKRPAAHDAAAADQEMAAAILLNDKALPSDWARAWSACVVGEGAESSVTSERPGEAFESKDGGATTTEATPTTSSSASPTATIGPGVPPPKKDGG